MKWSFSFVICELGRLVKGWWSYYSFDQLSDTIYKNVNSRLKSQVRYDCGEKGSQFQTAVFSKLWVQAKFNWEKKHMLHVYRYKNIMLLHMYIQKQVMYVCTCMLLDTILLYDACTVNNLMRQTNTVCRVLTSPPHCDVLNKIGCDQWCQHILCNFAHACMISVYISLFFGRAWGRGYNCTCWPQDKHW